jgi:tripartite-type tricarboxylate transporter receptor subunit TctC
LLVHPSLPVRSVADLIVLAKEKPGQLSFGSSGVGGPPHLYTELLKTMTGVQMTHIPYKGTAQAINDVVAGHVPIIFSDIAPAVQLIKDGRLRALGISSATRFANLPDIPPIGDTVPGFDAIAWLMIVAPAGTPKPVVGKLHGELKAIVSLPEVGERLLGIGNIPLSSPPPEVLQAYVKSEIVRRGKVVQQAGLAGSAE